MTAAIVTVGYGLLTLEVVRQFAVITQFAFFVGYPLRCFCPLLHSFSIRVSTHISNLQISTHDNHHPREGKGKNRQHSND